MEPEEQRNSLETSVKRSNVPVILVLGMAGSGKTTFVHGLASYLIGCGKTPYIVNLDPAVHVVPYIVNIDIRDTVKYKEVMSQYGLGPNGAIVTSLNLFTTKFHQVMDLLTNRSAQVDYIIVDTPGQIEVFNWSASGNIIANSLASVFPTTVVYVADSAKSVNPVTFMSNMLYACSILYKYRLPFIVTLNKADIVSPAFIREWMTDFEKFDDALQSETSYVGNLARSMSLVLDKFYSCLKSVAISSITGEGMSEFVDLIAVCVCEYHNEFVPSLEAILKHNEQARLLLQREKLSADGIGNATEARIGAMQPGSSERQLSLNFAGSLESDTDEAADNADDANTEENVQSQSFQRFLNKSKNA